MPRMQDVVIVGGGPAGLHAAARLSTAGFSTTLIEEHASVGDPVHCTGVLAKEAFSEFGLSRASLLNELSTARFWSPSGRQVTYSSPKAEAVAIDRRVFDQELLHAAKSSGVTLKSSSRVTGVLVTADEAVVITTTGEIHARACVLACGANYSLHRALGLGMPRMFLHTAQIEVPAGELGDVELHFGSEVAPKGFAWVVPVHRDAQDCARIGVMCERDAPLYFDRLVDRVAGRWKIHRASIGRPRQKILPLSPISKIHSDRLLAIGDAAGLVKPTTGGGIYYSLASARLAADVLGAALHEDDLSEKRLRPYTEQWRERMSDELQAQLSLRLIAHRMSDQDIEALFELALTDGVMPIVRRTASFNRHRKLILALLKHPPVRQLLFSRLAF